MQRALEVVGQRQEGPEHGRPDEQRGQEGPAPVAVEDDAQREERVGGPLLDQDEGDQQHGGDGEEHRRVIEEPQPSVPALVKA